METAGSALLMKVIVNDNCRPASSPTAAKGREIVVLITVLKKTNRIPKRQIDTAMRRMKEIQHG